MLKILHHYSCAIAQFNYFHFGNWPCTQWMVQTCNNLLVKKILSLIYSVQTVSTGNLPDQILDRRKSPCLFQAGLKCFSSRVSHDLCVVGWEWLLLISCSSDVRSCYSHCQNKLQYFTSLKHAQSSQCCAKWSKMSAAYTLPSSAIRVLQGKHHWLFHNSLQLLPPLWHSSVSSFTLQMTSKACFINVSHCSSLRSKYVLIRLFFSIFTL